MIVGSGDIASVLGPFDTKGFNFFASGVSNSQEKRESEYGREYKLLMEQPRDARLVYFSTLSIFYGESRYITHKLSMEQVVRETFPQWTIIRLGNITWGNNPHTLINFFRRQLQEGVEPTIVNADRFIVELEEFLYWITLIPGFNCELNIPGQRMKVREVWEKYVGHRVGLEAPCPI